MREHPASHPSRSSSDGYTAKCPARSAPNPHRPSAARSDPPAPPLRRSSACPCARQSGSCAQSCRADGRDSSRRPCGDSTSCLQRFPAHSGTRCRPDPSQTGHKAPRGRHASRVPFIIHDEHMIGKILPKPSLIHPPAFFGLVVSVTGMSYMVVSSIKVRFAANSGAKMPRIVVVLLYRHMYIMSSASVVESCGNALFFLQEIGEIFSPFPP